MFKSNLNPPAVKTPPVEDSAWAEMLALIGEKHSRLSRAVPRLEKDAVRETRRLSLVAEVEKERARIARDLHAGAGQPLAGIKITLELLEKWSESMPEETREAVARLNRLTEAALGQVRAVSHRLHPPDWQELSMGEALELLVNESGVTEKCETSLRLGPLPPNPPHNVKVVLYRCAQECISNTLRHSGASRFRLAVAEADGWITMDVSDDGRGIPDDAAKRGGIGLTSIREHAEGAGGYLRIDSGENGTTIQIRLPLTED